MVKDSYDREFPLEDMKACVGPGWGHLIEKLYKICDEHNVPVVQVKEKFGGLRFYVDDAPENVHDIIKIVEEESEHTCEKCGEPGKIRSNHGWLECRCSGHKGKECIK